MNSPETDIEDTQDEKQTLDLDVKVDKTSACERHVAVTISKEDVNRYFSEAYDELMPSANVPGFRAGRAPRKLVEQKFRAQVSDQVKGSLLMDSLTQISDENEFSAISEPDIDFDAVDLPEDGPLKFEFNIEVRPEFDLPKWEGLKLDKLTRDFTAEDVDARLKEVLHDKGELAPTDGPVEAGHYITVNITSKLGDKKISEKKELTIPVKANLSFPDAQLEGFDQLVIGAQAGETKSTKVTVSHDSAAVDLQGAELDVDIEILEIKELELPELDDEILGRLGDFENEGELRDRIKDELERRMGYEQQRRTRHQITSLLTESADWELPPDLVKRQSKRELERASMEMRSAGFSDEEVSLYENELRQNSLASTKKALHEHFILERIAEDQDIEADTEDYDLEVTMIALQQNESPRRIRAQLEKRGLMDSLRNQIIERKVLKLIESKANFKETPYEPEKNEATPVDMLLSGVDESAIPEAKHAGGESEPLQQPVDRT